MLKNHYPTFVTCLFLFINTRWCARILKRFFSIFVGEGCCLVNRLLLIIHFAFFIILDEIRCSHFSYTTVLSIFKPSICGDFCEMRSFKELCKAPVTLLRLWATIVYELNNRTYSGFIVQIVVVSLPSSQQIAKRGYFFEHVQNNPAHSTILKYS